jgi:hypothetical protein
MNQGSINEDELRDFARRLGHEHAGGCSEWVLLDPRTQEIRATGLFTDVDMLIATLPMYVDMYNVQACRNPRPLAALSAPGQRNQFNRASQKIVPLEQLEMLTQVVFTLKPRNKNTPESIAVAACGLMVRLGIGKYSVEQGGPYLCIRMTLPPTPVRKYGSPDAVRLLFVKLEEAFRDSMTPDEREQFEFLPRASPELFDPPVGIAQISGNVQFPGRRLYAPADAPDPMLEQILNDLHAGKALPHQQQASRTSASATVGAPKLDGLLTDWEDHHEIGEESFEEGTGILPKGAPLKIESDEGKQAKGQIEALENLSREAYLRRTKHLWSLPWPSRTLSQKLGGGSRCGEVALVTANSQRLVRDYLSMALEGLLKQSDVLGFWASTRQNPGDFWARSLERHTGKNLAELEGIDGDDVASSAQAQVRSQYKRTPMLLSLEPSDSIADLARQIRELRESDAALARLPGILVLDGYDDFCQDPQALRTLRHLAASSHLAIWLGSTKSEPGNQADFDMVARMVSGEEDLQDWMNGLAESDPEKALAAQVLPRLLPEIQGGRQPSVLHTRHVAESWSVISWQLWYPGTGRFQNLAPRKDG